jgi:hypothetical protein
MKELTILAQSIINGPMGEVDIKINEDKSDYYVDDMSNNDKLLASFQMSMFMNNDSITKNEFCIRTFKHELNYLVPINGFDKKFTFINYGAQREIEMTFNEFMLAVNISAFNWMIHALYNQNPDHAKKYDNAYNSVKEVSMMLADKSVSNILSAID